MNSLIKIENLFFSYENDQNILENIILDIQNDDFLAIIGPNGGGKTTLLKLILGLLKPKSGTVKLKDENNFLGYVPQNTNLNTDFPITALEVVLMGHIGNKTKRFGYSKDEIICAMNSLKQVSMEKFANTKIGNLSGGQRQRVFIARALCAHPKVILLDEPTASIDAKGQKEIYELLKKLNETICIVVVSHDISVLLHYAKSVAHINKNLVYHSLDNYNKTQKQDEDLHFCEVELLQAFGKNSSCECNKGDKC